MTTSYATFAGRCPEQNIPLLRELISLDSLCPVSYPLARIDDVVTNGLLPTQDHSPLHWSRQTEWPWILREGDFGPTDRVLDIGGGWSVLRYAIAKRCHHLTSVDNDPPSVAIATRCAIDAGYHNIDHIEGDARQLAYPDNHFDKTVCVSVLEHIPNQHRQCVREAVRVTKPGGLVLLTMDVVVQGKAGQENNFYLDLDEAVLLVEELGLTLIPGLAIMGGVGLDLTAGVLLIRYEKPI